MRERCLAIATFMSSLTLYNGHGQDCKSIKNASQQPIGHCLLELSYVSLVFYLLSAKEIDCDHRSQSIQVLECF